MTRTLALLTVLSSIFLWAQDTTPASLPSFDYEAARQHETQPHRRLIRVPGVTGGFNQLHLVLTVSPAGDVTEASATGDARTLKFWPQLKGEVSQWKFSPFEENGKAVTAEVEEYIDLVPPERLPTKMVPPPALRPDSVVSITLARSGCFGSCPSYKVTVSTTGIEFDGQSFVAAAGRHIDHIDADDVRKFAKKFVTANFYSMDDGYHAGVTDMPTYTLAIDIDGQAKQVVDYVGSWVGMPEVISTLEDEVDALARTKRWVGGSDGLVQALRAEEFNFQTYDAQVMVKEAAAQGQLATVRQLLEQGVPLQPLPPTDRNASHSRRSGDSGSLGWLSTAAAHPEVLRALIDAGASKDDQHDKDYALERVVGLGDVVSARAVIAYGAKISADSSGSLLASAAASGNPEMVREVLRHHPRVDARNSDGRTAVFAVGEYRRGDKEGARAECLRLLVQAGADVNARDKKGNTPLHETYLPEVEEELLKLGADVNARNHDGETPIFTTYDESAVRLFIEHGADLAIRNNKGQTAMEAAAGKGPDWQKAFREAMQKRNEH
jgi:ankyrin repeat protein